MQYVAFLRGINVGGHHKVPMQELKALLSRLNYQNIITLLNSGNIIFEKEQAEAKELEIELEQHFSFQIPCIIRKASTILDLVERDPFAKIELTKDRRFYVSLLPSVKETELKLPYTTADKSFTILEKIDNDIFSLLDLSIGKTPKAMEVLEKTYGKNITTRNWNTILKIEQKIKG